MEIRIVPTRQLFFSEESDYGIYGAEVHPDDLDKGVKLNKYGNISFKGTMPKLTLKEQYIVTIKEDSGSTFEGSYILEGIRQPRPETISEQKVFLQSVLTESQANSIFEVYNEGQNVVGMIEDGTFDYSSVKGIGEKTFEKLRDKVIENIEMSEVLVFLSKYGIKYNMIKKLVKEYKNAQIVIQKIEENPYLLTEIKGIGFLKADMVAKAVGYDLTSPHRIGSCIRYVIGEENSNGNSWVGRKQLLNRCIDLLSIKKTHIEEVLNKGAKGILNLNDRFTTEKVYYAEDNVSMRVAQFKTQSKPLYEKEELDTFLDEYCAEWEVELEENQRKFFHHWNENNMLFLVGGGGMGKSWLQRILLELIAKKNLSTALLAPTGK